MDKIYRDTIQEIGQIGDAQKCRFGKDFDPSKFVVD